MSELATQGSAGPGLLARVRAWWREVVVKGTKPIEVSLPSELGVDDAAEAIREGLTSPLRASLVPAWPSSWFSSAPRPFYVTGRVRPPGIWLVPHDGFQNSWRPSFKGRLEPATSGCELRGEIALPTGTVIFFLAWLWLFVILMVFGDIATAGALISGQWHSFLTGVFILMVGPLILLGGLSIRGLALRLSQRSSLALEDWLRARLHDEPTGVTASDSARS